MKKGISLVALVITIIVLIILTSAAILSTNGERGIIEKTREAVEKNNIQVNNEKALLTINKLKLEAADKGNTFYEYISNSVNTSKISSIIAGDGFTALEVVPNTTNYKLIFDSGENVVIDKNGTIISELETGDNTEQGSYGEIRTITISSKVGVKYYANDPDPFTITFEEGMTWGQWIDSQYNNTPIHKSQYSFLTNNVIYYEGESGALGYNYIYIVAPDKNKECKLTDKIPTADCYYNNGWLQPI